VNSNDHEPLDLQIKPGTTPSEILTQLNLEGYVLSLQPNPDQLLSFFEDDEELYSQLPSEARLCAIKASAAVDAYIHQFVYGSF
jgi:hypothetical protein